MMKSIRTNNARNTAKLYAEITIDTLPTTSSVIVGMDDGSQSYVRSYPRGVGENERYTNSLGWKSNGTLYNRTTVGGLPISVPSFAEGDVLSMLIDLDAGEVTFRKNNVDVHTLPVSSLTYHIAVSLGQGAKLSANVEGPFTYTLPTGYVAWEDGSAP